MFRKIALTALGACLLFATESANATSAEAGVRCVAVAERINGSRVQGTRTAIDRRREVRACNIALRVCEDKLQDARYYSGRPMPFAQCQVVRVRHVGFSGPHPGHFATPPRHAPRHHAPRYTPPPHSGHSAGAGGYCNFSACDHRYRSIRASDCTFQPYHGPRKHCAL
jgi:hypothetical protein